ncbi:MAG: BON domain-containing protein [Candidatus Berkiella sp.]
MKKTALIVTIFSAASFTNAWADLSSSGDASGTTSGAQSTYVSTEAKTEAPSDTSITANVKSAFLKEKLFGDADVSAFTISVETKDGVVHLTGTADNQTQSENAVKLAKGVEGVKDVMNDVKIKVTTN